MNRLADLTGVARPAATCASRSRNVSSAAMLAIVALVATVAMLSACSSFRADGPPANPPPDLIQVPDADPRLEPILTGGPNKPYEALGHLYTPIREDIPFSERGLASWYGRKFQGKRTASGEPFDPFAMSAAHRTLPIPSYVRVRNPKNGREIVVRINDRGPFHSDRVIDLSYTAALKLGVLNAVQPVELTRITFEDIRTGAWRRPGSVDSGVADAGSTITGSVLPIAARGDALGTVDRNNGAANVNAKVNAIANSNASGNGSTSANANSNSNPNLNPNSYSNSTPTRDRAKVKGGSATATDGVPVVVAPVAMPSVRVDDGQATSASASGIASTAVAAATASGNANVGSTIAANSDANAATDTSNMPSMTIASNEASASTAQGTPNASVAASGGGFWVQLGAFRQRSGADDFHRRVAADLAWLSPILTIASDGNLFRLQAGPYADRNQAQAVSQRIRESLRLVPVIVERR